MDTSRVTNTEAAYAHDQANGYYSTSGADSDLNTASNLGTLDMLLTKLAVLTTGYAPDPEKELQEKSYYDYPALKSHVWGREIIWYFFLGGLAAGSYVIASIASLFGSEEDRQVTRFGYYLSLITVLLCPPLLIKDLGRPERFLHMLRIFKFKSPMSVGTWGLSVFSIFSTLTVAIQTARDGLLGKWWGAKLIAKMPQKLIAIPGTLLATFVGGYTSVLLSATSIAVWNRSRMLGVVFIASAFSTGTALTTLVLRIVGAPASTLHKMEKFEWFNMLIEIVGLLAFLRNTGRASKALVGIGPKEQGRTFWPFMFGGGLILPWILNTIMLLTSNKKHHKSNKKEHGGFGLIITLIVLIGGYFLRKTVVEAGHVSGDDARTSLWNARS